MCGLVGVINKQQNGFYKEQVDIFAQLLYLDYFRGMDSTGILLINNNGDAYVAKEASAAHNFLQTDEFAEVAKRAIRNGSALVGHNRKATRGVVNDENAHPFIVEDKIVLMHNGTMYGDHKKIADVEVDSHAIAHVIHEKDNVTEALNAINAAYALVWYNVDEESLNVVRNDDRPLCFIETHREIIFASEKRMLDFVVEGFKLNVTRGPSLIKPGNLQKFTLKNKRWDVQIEELKLKKETAYAAGPFRNTPSADDWREYQRWAQNNFGDAYGALDDDDDNLVVGRPVQQQSAASPVLLPGRPIQQQQSGSRPANENEANEYERKLQVEAQALVPNGQYHGPILDTYKYGTEHLLVAFDYLEIATGYWLYLRAENDPDILFRIYYNKMYHNEERIIQIASTGYKVKAKSQTLRWIALNDIPNSSPTPVTPGYVVITASEPVLISQGTTNQVC